MQKQLKTFFKTNEFNLVLLAFSSAIFLLRSNIPYAIYFFAFIQSLALFNSVRKTTVSKLFNILKQSVSSFYPYYIIIFFFIFGFVISPGETEVNKDLINLVILLSFIILFFLVINSLNQFKKFKETFIISFVLLFSAYLLISFILSAFNNDLGNFFFAINSSKSFDRNLYSLNLWISIIGIFVFVKYSEKKIWVYLANILLFLFLFLVLFSSSRRGIVIFGVFSITFISYQIYGYLKKTGIYRKFSLLFLLYSSIFLLILIIVFIPGNLRNQIFETLINDQETKKEIGITTSRYYKLFNPNLSFKEYQLLLWGPNFNSKDKKENNIDYKQLLVTAVQKYKEKDYTQSINLMQEAGHITDSIEHFFTLLPKEINKKLPVKNKKVIQYLPELVKLPYTYTKFFSNRNIKNLFLENYDADTLDFPFVFSFKKDSAQINLTLPALAQSEYELQFIIKSKNNPIDKLITFEKNGSQFSHTGNIFQKEGTIFHTYKIFVPDNNEISLNLSIFLKNNTDRFALSDMSWKLLSTRNHESYEKIYNLAKVKLKKFKLFQNQLAESWIYYLKTENLTKIIGQKKYSREKVIKIFKKMGSTFHVRNYSGAEILSRKNQNNVILHASSSLPRVSYNLPFIQGASFLVELNFTKKNKKQNLYCYFKSYPELPNVHFKSEIILDTLYRYSDNNFNRIIKVRVDSINNAGAIFLFGIKLPKVNDTIIVNSFSFRLLKIEKDSVFLSKTQYNYLKDWAKRSKKYDKIIEYKKQAKELENKSYWQIDSSVYESTASDRFELWLFGWQYYKSLPILKKIFGDGFNYYHVYKLKFGAKYRYEGNYFPHNPIISALLYSGILGALAYIFFLFQLFYYYIKNRKELGVFTLLFVLIFIYSFVSGKTHFTITYFVLFSIFPFLINHIKRSEKLNTKLNA